ncbi:MAG TPA: aldehyde dehydrogenase family protein, partial [Polyangiaceae bacterium]|nr:aldehyde dehydrogenase family protein [Polyangiaceae bacterium]
PKGSIGDAERAVERAAQAFPAWSATTVQERAEFLQKLQGGLAARMNEIAEVIASEVGMPIKLSSAIQVGLPTLNMGSCAELVRNYQYEEQVGNSLVVREPVGVVACITPWNYPLLQVVAKVAPALGAGCTVVLKPSEVAPLSAFILTEIIHAAGLPPGVFNLVSGDGPSVGEALVTHPKVDMVSFTGSTRAGKRISELAAQSVKRVALELGGKSASVVLEDADLEKAVTHTVQSCYLNSGQTCSAHTRLLVPKNRLAEAERYAKGAAEGFTLGNALSDDTRLGPLVSATQRERVRDYIEQGVKEGAKLVTGGAEPPEQLEKGYFVRPTVFTNVRTDMRIAQEEIFGPVLCIIPYDSEEDAVRIANDTIYGLAGGVWSKDPDHAKRVARRMRTGQVDINGGNYNPNAPFGGFKQSGHGREYGRHGLEEFLEIKSLQL